MEKKNAGETLVLESKHDESVESVTCAVTLVPPEPKPEASLTWR